MSLSRSQLNTFLSEIDITNKTVLDVGAGTEECWILKKVKGTPKKYTTLDIEQKGVTVVSDINYEIALGKYDTVFCIETLEHCWNPYQVIKNLYRWTAGVCYISTPFINPHHDKVDYLRYTGEWFEEVLKKVGFKEIEIKERVATEGLQNLKDFYLLEGMRVSKIRKEFGKYSYPIGYFVKATV